MNTTFQIRPVTIHDAKEIARLAGQLGYPVDEATMERRLAVILKDRTHAVFVAEAEAGVLLGWIDAYLLQSVESEFSVEVAGLVVDEAQRRRGIGKALLAQTEEWGRARQAARVTVRCNTKRLESHRFYETLGYQNVKTQITFRRAL
jgi:GNAT superfamily N-acetyltransferase